MTLGFLIMIPFVFFVYYLMLLIAVENNERTNEKILNVAKALLELKKRFNSSFYIQCENASYGDYKAKKELTNALLFKAVVSFIIFFILLIFLIKIIFK